MNDQGNNPYNPPEREENADRKPDKPKEVGGRKGPEPTRYGDWENNGIASDF